MLTLEHARAAVDLNPSAAQIEAGNYRKGHVSVQGLDITIENPRGAVRRSKPGAAKPWESRMRADYGYLKRTAGADGDHVDVFLGPHPDSQLVFVVDQARADGTFDEHKAIIGCLSEREARALYAAHYPNGWRVGPITALTMAEFKHWLAEHDTTKPIAPKRKPARLIFFKAPGDISRSGNNFLGIDQRGRMHWRRRIDSRQLGLFDQPAAMPEPIAAPEGMPAPPPDESSDTAEPFKVGDFVERKVRSADDGLARSEVKRVEGGRVFTSRGRWHAASELQPMPDHVTRYLGDIPVEAGYRAHSGTSYSPELRAEQERQSYADTLAHDHAALGELATTPDKKATLDREFEQYRQGYRARYLSHLSSRSRVVSSMIAGPSRFPAARMAKRGDSADRRREELLDYRTRELARIRKELTPELQPIRMGASDAESRLREKLEAAEKLQAGMKAINDAHKRFLKNPASLDSTDLTESQKRRIREYKPEFSWEPHPIAPFELTNNAANIRRMRTQLEEITRHRTDTVAAGEQTVHDQGGVSITNDPDEDRVKIKFPHRLSGEAYALLKRSGWRWSPTRGVFMRQLTPNAQASAKQIVEAIARMEQPYTVAKARLGLFGRWLAKAQQLGLFGGIKQNPDNHLGTDQLGRPHWRANPNKPKVVDLKGRLASVEQQLRDANAEADALARTATGGPGYTPHTQRRAMSLWRQAQGLETRRQRLALRVRPPMPLFDSSVASAEQQRRSATAVAVVRTKPHDFDILNAWDRLSPEGQSRVLAGLQTDREHWNALPTQHRADVLAAALGGGAASIGDAAAMLRDLANRALVASKEFERAGQTETVAASVDVGPQPDPRTAAKLRAVADNMTSTIDEHLNPGVSRQNVTARRSRIAAGMISQGEHLERVQSVLYALADLQENGTVPPLLIGVRNRAQVEQLLLGRPYELKPSYWDKEQTARMVSRFPRPVINVHDYKDVLAAVKGKRLPPRARELFVSLVHRTHGDNDHSIPLYGREEVEAVETVARVAQQVRAGKWGPGGRALERLKDSKRAWAMGLDTQEKWDAAATELHALVKVTDRSAVRRLQEIERRLIGLKIPGYFPTPTITVEKLIELADIQPGMTVLEPSAGKGNIADVIRARHPESPLSVVEYASTLCEVLEAKGYRPVGTDFLQFQGQFDRIVMNPPWGKEVSAQDTDHVMHAYACLKPGGRLVAIMGEHAFFADDRRSREFRSWLATHHGTEEKLPPKSFMSSERPTGVNVRVVVIDKPASPAESPAARVPTFTRGNRVQGRPGSGHEGLQGWVLGSLEPDDLGIERIHVAVESPERQRGSRWFNAGNLQLRPDAPMLSEREELTKALFYLIDEDLPAAAPELLPALTAQRAQLEQRIAALDAALGGAA